MLPLPDGEGWGEGDYSVLDNGRLRTGTSPPMPFPKGKWNNYKSLRW